MHFLGRMREKELLSSCLNRTAGSSLSVVYGRRRIGKTRLVEESFKEATLLKFEGLEGQPTAEQQSQFLRRLAEVAGAREYELVRTSKWTDILILLSRYVAAHEKGKPVVVLLDEFQWMAAGRTRLVSSLKYVWDNYFTTSKRVHLILCGSVGSFLVKKVLRSTALYGRIHLEINLGPLKLPEIGAIFRPTRSLRDVVELYMALGGVPQYLEMVDPAQSPRANIERLCFTPHGYLVNEFERIFTSHFGSNQHFRSILTILARESFASRDQLQEACSLTSGGRVSDYLDDLELAGFVERYSPADKPDSPRIVRYRIVDPFLLFYFRFIRPSLRRIKQAHVSSFSTFVPDKRYAVWRGLAFESLCRQHSQLIADKLGFGAVQYDSGSWFSRNQKDGGSQIDLLFIRADRVMTLCEIKFQDASIGTAVIADIEKKVAALPNPKGLTLERVLITASPPTADLIREGHFNRILQLEDLFGA